MRAIVTIIDEKTGHIFQKDKLVEPYREQRDPFTCVTRYDFRFEFNVNDLYFRDLLDNIDDLEDKEEKAAFHCGVEESGFHAYNCNDCPNKCEEWYQWDKEMKND